MSAESWEKESSYILTCAERHLGSFGKQRIHVNRGLQDTAGVQDRPSGQGWAHQRCWCHLWGSVLKEEGGKEPHSSQREEWEDVEMPGDCKVSAGGAGGAPGTGDCPAALGDPWGCRDPPGAAHSRAWGRLGACGKPRQDQVCWQDWGPTLEQAAPEGFHPMERKQQQLVKSSHWRSSWRAVCCPLWNRTGFCEEGAERDWPQPHSLSPCTAGQEEMQKIRKLSPTKKGGVGRKCFKIWF